MDPERKPLERPEPNLKPVAPEMPKGVAPDQSSREPDTEVPKEKRKEDL